MKKRRIIPIVLFQNGQVVQSKNFTDYRNLGSPADSLKRLSDWNADEVHFIDISTEKNTNFRTDLEHRFSGDYLEVLSEISRISLMPLAAGGKIRSMPDIASRLKAGADKVIINSALFSHPVFIEEAVKFYGSQCITASIDVKSVDSEYVVFSESGKKQIDLNLPQTLEYIQSLGVGEILVNSIDRDGSKTGFDLSLIEIVTSFADVPVVVAGGAGKWEDFACALEDSRVDGLAAANIFQHVDQSVYLCHSYLKTKGYNVRPPKLSEV